MVSCVPGSPIDCAAMTPTASPLVDRRAAGQIASVADRADADLDLAGQRRADADRLDAGLLDRVDVALVDQRAGLDDQIARNRMSDVVERRTAEDALAERRDDLAGIDDRLHGEALVGAAVDAS